MADPITDTIIVEALSETAAMDAWLGAEIFTGAEVAGGVIGAGELAAVGSAGADALGWGSGALDVLGDAATLGETAAMGNWLGGAEAQWYDPMMDFGAFGSTAADMAGGVGAGSASFLPPELLKTLKAYSPLFSIGSGLYGLQQADAMREMAALASRRADPWGQSGGRALADQQLQQLMRDPTQVAQNDPAYKLRMQAVQRANAGYGQNSGAMAVGAANASTDWLNQRMASLGGLAGSGGSPGAGDQLALTGMTGANSLASQALASIGYGAARAAGPEALYTPEMLAKLRAQGANI